MSRRNVPLAVRLQRGKHRLVDLDKGGSVAIGSNGKPIDKGGEATESGRRRLIKQAQAVNLAQQAKKQRMIEGSRYKRKSPKRGRMKEEAVTLPVLDLAGVDYSLQEMAAGRPGLLVVEDPEEFAGKSFRFAEGDGFRSLSLGEAAGPFHSIMALPLRTIHGLDSIRLRELRDARALYLVPIAEAAKLQEEGEDEPEGGMHWHQLDRDVGMTLEGEEGWHRHLFLVEEDLELGGGMAIPAGSLIVTERDGGHQHAIDKSGNLTEEDGKHSHVLVIQMPGGDPMQFETTQTGEHIHQLMVQRTGLDGLHQHQLTINSLALTSLTPAEFADLESAGAAPEDVVVPATEETVTTK